MQTRIPPRTSKLRHIRGTQETPGLTGGPSGDLSARRATKNNLRGRLPSQRWLSDDNSVSVLLVRLYRNGRIHTSEAVAALIAEGDGQLNPGEAGQHGESVLHRRKR
jgi:hypothetical protein